MRTAYKTLVGNLKGQGHFGGLQVKRILSKKRECRLDSFGSCEHGNEPSSSLKGRQFESSIFWDMKPCSPLTVSGR
jgi:hypothetical protein